MVFAAANATRSSTRIIVFIRTSGCTCPTKGQKCAPWRSQLCTMPSVKPALVVLPSLRSGATLTFGIHERLRGFSPHSATTGSNSAKFYVENTRFWRPAGGSMPLLSLQNQHLPSALALQVPLPKPAHAESRYLARSPAGRRRNSTLPPGQPLDRRDLLGRHAAVPVFAGALGCARC